MRKFTLDAIPQIAAIVRKARDSFEIYDDLPELVAAARAASIDYRASDWTGHKSGKEAIALTARGDLSAVPSSDKYLEKLSAIMPQSKAFETVDSVIGAVPNVGAYLSGSPYNMRLRRRTTSEAAPLTIIVDTASSGGIDADKIQKRGAAILALVRSLATARPVELFAGITVDTAQDGAIHIYARLETAPLDLARAAFFLTHPSVSRAFLYRMAQRAPYNSPLQYPYGDIRAWKKLREAGHAILARGFSVMPENILYVPPVILNDESISNPEKWITDKLAQYGTMKEAA